ncbi:hypothetical protein EMIT0111MI5_60029 [Burkholderia sp. IT-111MI5]
MAITSASQADDVGSIPIARSTFRLHGSLRKSRLVEGGFFVPCAGSPDTLLRATGPRPQQRLSLYR